MMQRSQSGDFGSALVVGRRGVMFGIAAVALTACTQTLMEPAVAQGVTVRRISVLTDNVTHFSVRELAIDRQRFAADLTAAVRSAIGARARGDGNAELIINVNRVWLKSPGESFLLGGPSFVDAEVTVRNVADGTVIAGPTTFSGISSQTRMGGIVGALSAPSAQDDYDHTLQGFATMINEALFEGGTTTY